MTKEDLFEAIGGIDDAVLVLGDSVSTNNNAAAGVLSKGKTKRPFFLQAKRWTAAAACLIVVALGAVVFKGISSHWRMGSGAPKNAMQTADGMMMEESAELEMNEAMPYTASEKSMTYGGMDELEYLITSNVAIGVSDPNQNAEVILGEEARSFVLGSLEGDTAVEGKVTEEEETADETPERGSVPATGGEPTTEKAQPEATALYILTFEQSDTTYVATLFDNRTLVFENEALETILLSEEEFNRLVSMLQNAK